MDPIVLVLMFAALGLMMFFGMRKQKRQAAETRKMQDAVVAGARIMTTSGLHGTVTAVADDTIELEIAPDVRTTWVRAAVREVIVPAVSDDVDEESADDDEFDFEDGMDFDDDVESTSSVEEDSSRQSDVG